MSQKRVTNEREPTPVGVFEYRFGSYRVRSDDLVLRFNDAILPLGPKVVKTLIVLLERAGRFVSKDELLQLVWDGPIVEEANLSQNVYMLRRQFETSSGETFIQTLPKRGYRFAARVIKLPIEERRRRFQAQSAWLVASALAACLSAAALIPYGFTVHAPTHASPLPPAAETANALGWYYWRGSTPADLRNSIRHFRLVVNAAPKNPAGYAGEAVSYAKLADLWQGSPSGLVAAVAAEKLSWQAVDVGANSALARAARGFIEYDIDGNNRDAAADLQAAIRTDPDLPVAHLWYGAVVMWEGDLGTARAEVGRACDLDASLPGIDYLLALDFYMSRDYPEAITYAKLDNDVWSATGKLMLLSAAHEQLRQYAAAIQAAQSLRDYHSDALAASGALAHIYAEMGQQRRSRQELKIVERLSEGNETHPLLVALAYSANGRPNEAFVWLSRLPPSDRTLFGLDPRLDLLRQDRRFERWLRS